MPNPVEKEDDRDKNIASWLSMMREIKTQRAFVDDAIETRELK